MSMPLARSTNLRVSSCSSRPLTWSSQGLQLPEAPHRHLQGGYQVAALERLDEVGQRAGVTGPLDQVRAG